MAKARRSTIENNRKMTEFFSQQSTSSTRTLPSSQPMLSAKHAPGKQTLDTRKIALTQSQPVKPSQSKRAAPLQARTLKKENAPPPSRTRAPPPHEVTYVSSSSDAATRISISSTSVRSADSSIVEVVPPVKHDLRHMQSVDVSSSSPIKSQKRRSSRLKESQTQPARRMAAMTTSQPRRQAPKKRKKPDGIQSDDGDVIDVDTMEEVIYVSTKPATVNLLSPEPLVRSRRSPARKRTCLNTNQPQDASSAAVEVIPSSQSAEQELSPPKKTTKDLKEIGESVREWQLSSQPEVPPDSSDAPDLDTNLDESEMDLDFEYPRSSPEVRDRSKTPVSGESTMPKRSPPTTPHKESRGQSPSKSLTPRGAGASNAAGSIRKSTGSMSPSPMLPSSASSSTRVDDGLPMYAFSPKKTTSPRNTPTRKFDFSNSPRRRRSPHAASNVGTNEKPLINQEEQWKKEMEEKTNAIVERIKAEAHAKAIAMQDEGSMVLGSLDDSDSDLGSPTNLLKFAQEKKPARASKQPSTLNVTGIVLLDDGNESPLTDLDDLDDEQLRRSSRQQNRRSLSPSLSSAVGTRTRKQTNMLPTVLTSSASAPPKRKPVDPLSKLLKEKARHQRFADILNESKLDTGNANLFESDAAERRSSFSRSGSPSKLHRQPSDESDLEKVVGEIDRRKLFGEDDRQTLGRIFESDRRGKGKGKAKSTELGVTFWEPCSDDRTGTGYTLPEPPNPEYGAEDSSLELLKEFIDAKDMDGIALLLRSGTLVTKNICFPEWLLEVVARGDENLATAAFAALEHLCEALPRDDDYYCISESAVAKVLWIFGARREVLDALQIRVPPGRRLFYSSQRRGEALWRLSELVRLVALYRILSANEVPVHFALLLAVGMDPTSDSELKSSIKRTLHALINSYCEDFSFRRGEIERGICSRVLAIGSDLTPPNKEYLLSFIDSDNPMERRIGQWIGFAMLTGGYGVQLAKESNGTPPLSAIKALLNPRMESNFRSDLFNVSRNSERFDSFDFVALAYHIGVLGRVLMNIPLYIEAEKQGGSQSTSKPRNEVSMIKEIKDQLDHLRNNISDTGAERLDRSQAKAAILQLSLRIDAQRKACGQSVKKPRIDSFFKRKSTTAK